MRTTAAYCRLLAEGEKKSERKREKVYNKRYTREDRRDFPAIDQTQESTTIKTVRTLSTFRNTFEYVCTIQAIKICN